MAVSKHTNSHTATKGYLTYGQLAFIYFKMGGRAFGGWSTTYLLLEQEFSIKRKLLTIHQLQAAAASGQTLPGPAQVIIAAQAAYYLKGIRGAFVATTAYLLPSTVLTLVFSFIYFGFLREINITRYTLGLQAAVGGIILGNAYRIGKTHASSLKLWAIVVGAAIICYVTNLPAILVILSFGLIGLILTFIQKGSRA